ncbi:UDP-glucose 4-epimerase GalE [Candidatus Peregrinibacteria bacterium]|nr:UDP-glucose 4-epimerase GalE [Candidatus Peregrinibacteria bacterium]
MPQHILVTGGAGYIGSHVVRTLLHEGYTVSVLDNLINGHRKSVASAAGFYQIDLGDVKALRSFFDTHSFDAVMHFAAFIEAGISMRKPAEFFENNCVNGFHLLNEMLRHGIKTFVFSSTAAVYGDPVDDRITEDHRLKPVNHYGRTKLMFEQLLNMYEQSYGLSSVALRYFNASGADDSGGIGEDHAPETHLIPLVLQTAVGLREYINIFGTNYDTPDGTCIRDYIHVNDLASAHVLALKKVLSDQTSDVFNLGNGKGFSVKEVIEAARTVTGKKIPVKIAARREGDPAVLVADSTKAKRVLGWKPNYRSIQSIVESAWKWHESNPHGFQD